MFIPTQYLLQETARKSALLSGDEEIGILALADLGLISADFNPSADTLFADLTEANYNTYARQQIALWGTPVKNALGLWTVQGSPLTFTPTDDLQPNLIYGYAIFEDAGDLLLGCEKFDTPIALADVIDSLTVVPRIGPWIANPWGASLIG